MAKIWFSAKRMSILIERETITSFLFYVKARRKKRKGIISGESFRE